MLTYTACVASLATPVQCRRYRYARGDSSPSFGALSDASSTICWNTAAVDGILNTAVLVSPRSPTSFSIVRYVPSSLTTRSALAFGISTPPFDGCEMLRGTIPRAQPLTPHLYRECELKSSLIFCPTLARPSVTVSQPGFT